MKPQRDEKSPIMPEKEEENFFESLLSKPVDLDRPKEPVKQTPDILKEKPVKQTPTPVSGFVAFDDFVAMFKQELREPAYVVEETKIEETYPVGAASPVPTSKPKPVSKPRKIMEITFCAICGKPTCRIFPITIRFDPEEGYSVDTSKVTSRCKPTSTSEEDEVDKGVQEVESLNQQDLGNMFSALKNWRS